MADRPQLNTTLPAPRPTLPTPRCQALGCLRDAAPIFCPAHHGRLPRATRDDLERALAPGGSVREAWRLIAEARRLLADRDARQERQAL